MDVASNVSNSSKVKEEGSRNWELDEIINDAAFPSRTWHRYDVSLTLNSLSNGYTTL